MLDKRQHERKRVKGEVAGKMILVDHVMILDLSMNGIRFESIRRVDMNSLHTIKIEKNGISLSVKGQVVRSNLCLKQQEGTQVALYEVAMTFRNLSQDAKKTLEKLISLLGNG
jgi:hypothetical protein